MSGALDLLKDERRTFLRVQRHRAAQNEPEAALKLRSLFLAEIKLPQQSSIAGYWAQDDEMDPLPLMGTLASQGHRLALPCVQEKKEQPLVFRRYTPGDKLDTGVFGIQAPFAQAPEVEPDVLLVPLLGFDRQGRRLGQGGGYYDRTLAFLREKKTVLAIGLAYAAQEIKEIPALPHDQDLNAVVTEKNVFFFSA